MSSTPVDNNLPPIKDLLAIGVIGIVLVLMVYVISVIAPEGGDWHIAYYPAARAFLSGHSPYYAGSYLENPVWICLILAPFGLFSERVGRALFLVVSIFCFYKSFQSVNVPRRWIPMIFLSPQILFGLNLGAIDALVLLAPAVHPILGFLLAMTKPQIGLGYAIYLIVEWIREGKFYSLVIALAASAGGILISIWLGMPFSGRLISSPWNTSLFPYSLLPGIALLFMSIYKKKRELSFIASPMMSPYTAFYSWVVLFMVQKPRYLVWVMIFSWVVYIVWHYASLYAN
jgi:hypothetical protein